MADEPVRRIPAAAPRRPVVQESTPSLIAHRVREEPRAVRGVLRRGDVRFAEHVAHVQNEVDRRIAVTK